MGTAREMILLKKPSVRIAFTKLEAGSILKIPKTSYYMILKHPLGLESLMDSQHTDGGVGYAAQKIWI